MKQRRIIFSFLLLAAAATASAQDNITFSRADSVDRLRGIIKQSNVLTSSAVGFAGLPSNTWYSFAWLTQLATLDELVAMTADDNPVLCLYAYTALEHRKYKELEQLTKRFSADKCMVRTLSGCIMDNTTVAQAVIARSAWYYAPALDAFAAVIAGDKAYSSKLFSDLLAGRQACTLPGKSARLL